MVASKWSLNAESDQASGTWQEYAVRYSALLIAVTQAFGGRIIWSEEWQPSPDDVIAPDDLATLEKKLVDERMRNDLDAVVDGGGSHPVLYGQGVTPHSGAASLVLKTDFGWQEQGVFVNIQVTEAPGFSLWSYPDQAVAELVARLLGAIDGSKAFARDRDIVRLLTKARASFDVGSHTFVPGPLDASRFPPGARQGPCGKGYLLIVPPGPTAEDTLERMRWVAAATGPA